MNRLAAEAQTSLRCMSKHCLANVPDKNESTSVCLVRAGLPSCIKFHLWCIFIQRLKGWDILEALCSQMK